MAVSPVSEWVKALTEDELGRPPFKTGDLVRHPSGRMVRITSGQFWGEHGLSNFWYWREEATDGSHGPEEHGYGWTP